jgi:hypothetical protein
MPLIPFFRWSALALALQAGPPHDLARAPAPAPAPHTAPVPFLQAALARHRVVFFGDIHPVAEPKRVVTQLIAEQGAGAGVDLLALEVGADEQGVVDRYMTSVPEDTTILMDHPRTLRAHWGASEEYLAIYRAAYRWNAAHPDHPVHVLAADLRGWPMPALTEQMAAGGFANRDEWMAAAFRKVLDAHPGWRVLVFMGGYHGLKSGGGEVMVGRAHDRFDNWFAGHLVQDGYDVYTVLSDARQESGHGATRVFDALAAADPNGNFVVPCDAAADSIPEPLYDVEEQGYHLEFWPSRFPISRAADAMLVLNRATPITLLGEPR